MRTAIVVLLLGVLALPAWSQATVTPGDVPVNPDVANVEPPKQAEPEKPARLLSLEELEPLLEMFAGSSSGEARQGIAQTLHLQVKDRRQEVTDIARKGKGTERLRAISLLGFTRTPEAVTVLVPLTAEADKIVARLAVTALGVNGDRSAIPVLTALLSNPDRGRAGAAAVALGRIGDKSVRPTLEAALANPDLIYRLSAIQGLGELKDPLAIPALEKRLDGKNPLEHAAIYDAMNLILGDDPFRIVQQLEKIAEILKQQGTGWETQLAQSAVTDALDRMIKEAEKKSEKGGGKSDGKKRQSGQQSGQASGGASSGASSQGATTPAGSSDVGERSSTMPRGVPGADNLAGVSWGNLPPAVREEVTAALKRDLPERYRHFLDIYYKILAEGK